MDDARSPKSRSQASQRRDEAMRRVGHVRRWVIGSSAALTAGFAVFVAQVAHGRSPSKTHHTSSAATARPAAGTEPALPAIASPGELGLQSPNQVPEAAPSPQQSAPAPAPAAPAPAPAAVSGGS